MPTSKHTEPGGIDQSQTICGSWLMNRGALLAHQPHRGKFGQR